jgi:hypothetical protein
MILRLRDIMTAGDRMSDEGVRILSRAALVFVLIFVTAAFRTIYGPSKQRGRFMLAGTVGGLATGLITAPFLSRALGFDVSTLAACGGVVLGWSVAWVFARRIPRNAE